MISTRLRISLAVALAAVGAAFFVPFRFAIDQEFWERFMDAVHLPLFFLITLALYKLLPRKRSVGVRAMRACVIAIALAGLTEIIQPLVGRGESFADFQNGALGALLATGGIFIWRSRSITARAVHAATTFGLLLVTSQPALNQARGILWRASAFPLLGDFESGAELAIWLPKGGEPAEPTRVERSSEQRQHGAHALKIIGGKDHWPGVSLLLADQDWTGYGALAFAVFAAEPFDLAIRIDDDGNCDNHDDRFNASLPLQPGWNQLRIPLTRIEHGPKNRLLNLRGIRRILFFLADGTPRTWFIDNVRLEK